MNYFIYYLSYRIIDTKIFSLSFPVYENPVCQFSQPVGMEKRLPHPISKNLLIAFFWQLCRCSFTKYFFAFLLTLKIKGPISLKWLKKPNIFVKLDKPILSFIQEVQSKNTLSKTVFGFLCLLFYFFSMFNHNRKLLDFFSSHKYYLSYYTCNYAKNDF